MRLFLNYKKNYLVMVTVFSSILLITCIKEKKSDKAGMNFFKNTGSSLPSISQYDNSLLKKIKEMKEKRGAAYRPRTKHLDKKGWAKYTNRLFLETGPYLLQHAHNPVNWYPWGDEVFDKAKALNRPILLSVGYSTCHWCHVMEEESFEDLEIAKMMNENYMAVKVDREERPDIDAIYMAVIQATTGSGGWPMTVWLTPEKKPIYGGTYIPTRDGDRGRKIGFLTMLKKLKEIYDKEPLKVKASANKISDFIKNKLESSTPGELSDETSLHIAIKYYKNSYDPLFGGINRAPKFPSSIPNRLLLRYYRRSKDQKVLEITEKTLKKMAAGGIYDHVGGGFHRYSTDKRWLVPHFEKMLYDNALLAMTYIEAYQVTKDKEYKRIAKEILDYVLRDMTSPKGGFYSATDADSIGPTGHRVEGHFFTWTPTEISQILSKKEAKLINDYYKITNQGNFEEGRSILSTPSLLKAIAKKQNLKEKDARKMINLAREKLYQREKKKTSPN